MDYDSIHFKNFPRISLEGTMSVRRCTSFKSSPKAYMEVTWKNECESHATWLEWFPFGKISTYLFSKGFVLSDHPHYCRYDLNSIYIGQDHHLAYAPHRNNRVKPRQLYDITRKRVGLTKLFPWKSTFLNFA